MLNGKVNRHRFNQRHRARRLEGCRVALNGCRANDETERLGSEIAAAFATDVVLRRADMSRPDNIEIMFEAVADELGTGRHP